MGRYNNYHKHSHKSNIFTPDTHIKNESYAKRAKELGHTTLFSTEHGWSGDQFEVYDLANKYEKFTVAEISTNEETEKIEKIKIADSKGNIVFSYGYPKTSTKTEIKKVDKPVEMIDANQIKIIHTLFTKIEKSESQVFKNFTNDKAKVNVYSQYKIKSSKELTKENANKMIDLLKKKVGE